MKKLLWFAILFFPTTCLSQVIYNEPKSRLIDREEAYSIYLDNRLKEVQTWWKIRDIYRVHQEERFDEIKGKRQFYLENHGLESLTNTELDLTSGTIIWFRPLTQTRYTSYRLVYDTSFKKNAYTGLEMEDYFALKQNSKEWRLLLAKQKEFYPDEVVGEMIRFILKLDREIKYSK